MLPALAWISANSGANHVEIVSYTRMWVGVLRISLGRVQGGDHCAQIGIQYEGGALE